MPATAKIIELRQLLAERFPPSGRSRVSPASTALCPTGLASLDDLLGGGLARGELTELVGSGAGSGSAQVIHQLLRTTAENGQFLALIDGSDSFDVDAVDPGVLARLLWVRCTSASEALKAADLLFRDRNFPVVVLDLKLNSAAQLRKIPSSTWIRFGRLLEHNPVAPLVVTPQPMVGSVTYRVQVEARLGHDALLQSPRQIASRLRFTLLRTAASAEPEAAQAG